MRGYRTVLTTAAVVTTAAVLTTVVTLGGRTGPVANAEPATQVLTTTLEVGSHEVVQDTHFVWNGPSDAPMLRLTGTAFATLRNLSFEVPDGQHAVAAVDLVSGPGGGPFGNDLTNLQIGMDGRPANVDNGLRWTGQVNGDSNTITDVAVFGAGSAGVSVANPQATGNWFRGLYVYHSPVGLQTAAGGVITCDGCGFIGSTDVDVELVTGAGLAITGMYSEGSRSFARITAGPGGAGLSVADGYWQHGAAAVGPTVTGLQMCCYHSWLRLTDFNVTPLGPVPAGTIEGVPADKRFLSNTAGIAG